MISEAAASMIQKIGDSIIPIIVNPFPGYILTTLTTLVTSISYKPYF